MDGPPSLYERPSVAASNLIKGDLRGTLQGLFAPMSLSPTRLLSTSDMVKSEDDGKITTLLKKIFTNPLFLFGAVMSMKYPIASAKELFQFKESMVGWGKSLGPIMRRVASVPVQFANTSIPTDLAEMMEHVGGFNDIGPW